VAVRYQLPRCSNAPRKPQSEDDIVEPPLQQSDQALHPIGSVQAPCFAHETTQLLFAQPIVEEQFLLFAKLCSKLGAFALLQLSVLTRWIVSLSQCTWFAQAGQLDSQGTLDLEFLTDAGWESYLKR
jgi:hypothetical protein